MVFGLGGEDTGGGESRVLEGYEARRIVSRTLGHISSKSQGQSEATKLGFTPCLQVLPSQPDGPQRGGGGRDGKFQLLNSYEVSLKV